MFASSITTHEFGNVHIVAGIGVLRSTANLDLSTLLLRYPELCLRPPRSHLGYLGTHSRLLPIYETIVSPTTISGRYNETYVMDGYMMKAATSPPQGISH